MQIYLVGGAVRDQLLQKPIKDRDYLVVGATIKDMLNQGFIPVGKDFPVFIHPKTGEEYALARTEKKSGQGYQGFTFHTDPNITLEEDLKRRDLTINAMAQDKKGTIIDPFNGQKDLQDKILRHISPAFSEDPLRILRVARFSARFDFEVAKQTLILMKQMVQNNELSFLKKERIWQEFSRALFEPFLANFFIVLQKVDGFNQLFGEFKPNIAKLNNKTLAQRYASLFLFSDTTTTKNINQRFAPPKNCQTMALLLVNFYQTLTNPPKNPAQILQTLQKIDAKRQESRFMELLNLVECLVNKPLLIWQKSLDIIKKTDLSKVIDTKPINIKQAIDDAYLRQLTENL